jgi:hypothetical protein
LFYPASQLMADCLVKDNRNAKEYRPQRAPFDEAGTSVRSVAGALYSIAWQAWSRT